MRKNPISKQEIEKIDIIIEDIKNGKLIINHPLQRYSKQWGAEQKGNLIRRVLHDGRFLPILICTQYDEYGCEVRYLIDGVQRMTTFEDYMNDGFSISKNTIDYMVDYDGILYETKETSSGKFCLKKDRKKNLIPILDENGNVQRRVQSIDIRGLKYSELPPELQEKISRYKVSVELKLECTDEDIQIEILDYNSGTKMNDAQIGKNRLGTEFARIVIELSNHSFIKNKCGFTADNRTKGVVDRAINETLMLVNFGAENWVVSHKDLCRRLSNWLTMEHTDKLREIFDELDSILPEEKEIKDYLTLKEFFVVVANYYHFRDCGHSAECYTQFLRDFITELSHIKTIPTGEIDDDGEEVYESFRGMYMNGSKQKANIEDRLEMMNSMLDEYLAENCEGMVEDETEVEDSEEQEVLNNGMEKFIKGFSGVAMAHNDGNTALKALMDFTDFPTRKYDFESICEFKNYFLDNVTPEQCDDCLYYAEILADNLKSAGVDGKFSSDDVAILIKLMKKLEDDYSDEEVVAWLKTYDMFRIIENPADSGQILSRESEFISSINNM